MTAESGILHEEMPSRGPDAIIDGFQLWVNLPAAQIFSRPRCQEVGADTIPVIEKKGCRVRVVAGVTNCLPGPVMEIAANPVYLDVTLEAGSKFNLPISEKNTVLTYVVEGDIIIGDTEITSVMMAVLGDGNQIGIKTGESLVRFMLMTGAPFGEPIVPYGPFVMNTCEEIQQAWRI